MSERCEYRDTTGGQCRSKGKACTVARIGLPSRSVVLCKHHEGKLSHTVTDQAINRIPEPDKQITPKWNIPKSRTRSLTRGRAIRGRDTSL
jgi:hypothetical protein